MQVSEIVKNNRNSIVHIGSFHLPKKERTQTINHKLNKFFSLGSGIIWNNKGHIVIYDSIPINTSKPVIWLKEKNRYIHCDVVGRDYKTRIALLKARESKDLTPVSIGNSSSLEVGDSIYLLAKPYGHDVFFDSGVIASKNLMPTSFKQFYINKEINKNLVSGGAFDKEEDLWASNKPNDYSVKDYGKIIPSNKLLQVVESLIKYGRVNYPWLGIVAENPPPLQENLAVIEKTRQTGVVVTNLIINGPSYKAGLKIGDMILSINGKTIHDILSLHSLLHKIQPGDPLDVEIYRSTENKLKLKIVTEDPPASEEIPQQEGLL